MASPKRDGSASASSRTRGPGEAEAEHGFWCRYWEGLRSAGVAVGREIWCEVRGFLERLAVQGKVSASTQNQALNALVFFFREGLGEELGELGEFRAAKRSQKIPVVLTRNEVDRHARYAAPGARREEPAGPLKRDQRL